MKLFSQAVPVWSIAAGEVTDQYRIFQTRFTLPESAGKDIFLDIAADSTYDIKINGKRCPGQQLADFPADRTAARINIASYLESGENVIGIQVHYLGTRFLTYRPGEAFLCAEIHDTEQVFSATGKNWKVITSPDMFSGLNCKLTTQLGFVFGKDARKSIPWGSEKCDESDWQEAVEVADSAKWQINLRSVPQLMELPRPDLCFLQMGYLKREKEAETFAISTFRDFLAPRRPREFFSVMDESQLRNDMVRDGMWIRTAKNFVFTLNPKPENTDGYYVVMDTGCERVGIIDLDISAPEGTIVDISHGEHLNDGRVSSLIGSRNFTDRLICAEGDNHLIYPHRRIGGRYIELHFTNCPAGEISIRYAGMIPQELPLPEAGTFHSEDRLMARINQVSIDTLKLSMHEHYEDCPWREQALYPYDSRNQILYGYHIWGNYEFVRSSLDLLGKSFDGSRYLELTSPGYTTLTIPVFTMVWISELYEYELFSGDRSLTEKWLGQVDKIIDAALQEKVDTFPGLYHSGTGEKIWNFSEWNGGLSNLKSHPQAPYNVYFCEAMRSAAKLHDNCGNTQRAAELRQTADKLAKNIEKAFYSPERGLYTAIAGDEKDEGYEHIQAIMLANEMVPAEKVETILATFTSGKLCGIDLSALYYLISAMMKHGAAARKFLTDYLRKILEPIVLSGATSLWETRNGASDFGYAGSLCHGWSSAMPYFCTHCLLGITPLQNGFKRFEVKPYSAGLSNASGSVPTPCGMIKVEWKKLDDGTLHVKVNAPEGLECVPAQWEESPVSVWEIN